jgi:diacylglycerol kinase
MASRPLKPLSHLPRATVFSLNGLREGFHCAPAFRVEVFILCLVIPPPARDFLERNYWNKIDLYTGERVLFGREALDNGFAQVESSLVNSKGEEVAVVQVAPGRR